MAVGTPEVSPAVCLVHTYVVYLQTEHEPPIGWKDSESSASITKEFLNGFPKKAADSVRLNLRKAVNNKGN